ncbi:unnamed protein product [Symbiodinium pilosum]|uniref:Uncharacterized protein n=1 Tax=Symbiodinium pilosum TaxID=2952 RepID=A0A812IYJ5_SYMPI|nr:unnamed protein product [Symbiodinium pilosum]
MLRGLLLQLLQMEPYALTTLALTWGGIIILCMGLAATTGLIQIVCNNAVENEKVRSLGIGIVQGANNFIGLSFGPLLPQVVMDAIAACTAASEAQTLFYGAVSIVAASFLVFGCVTSALSEAEAGAEEPHSLSKVIEDNSEEPLLGFCCGISPAVYDDKVNELDAAFCSSYQSHESD